MGFLDRLKGKKTEEKAEEKAEEQPTKQVETVATSLESICSDDREAYEALYHTMLLDPRKTEVTMKEAEEKAKDFEKKGDTLKAKIWYELAGGLAIYKLDVKNVKKYFSKCAKLSPNTSYPILKIPERALAKAQEYYQKHSQE